MSSRGPSPTTADNNSPDDGVSKHESSTNHALSTDPDKAPRDIHGWKWTVVAFALCCANFLFSLDTTIVAVIQATIVTEFNALDDLSWINVGFLLGGTAFTMIWGQMYSQFNSKHIYLFNVLVFEAGSALCGAAPTMNALIVGRVICGVGGSGLYAGVFTLIAQTTTLAERPVYVAWTGLTWALGIVLGPVVGGAFNQSSLGWRWAFYINLCIGAVCAPVWVFLVPSKEPRPGVSVGAKLRELDYAGMILLVGSLTCLILAIDFGGVKFPWNSGTTIGLFVASAVLFAMLAVQQVRALFTTLPRRLVPVYLARQPIMLILFVCTAASVAVIIPIYFVPLFFQLTRGDTGIYAGVRLLPFISALIVTVILNGILMARFGYYMPWYLVGGVLCVVGASLMYGLTGSTTPVGVIYGFTVLIGLGGGMWIQVSFGVAQAKADEASVPAAIGLMTLAQFLGTVIGMAIANTVFLNLAQSRVLQILGGGVSKNQVQAAITFAGTSAGTAVLDGYSEETRQLVIEAIVGSIGTTYILVFTAGAVVAVSSLFMKREKLFISAAAGGA